MEGGNPTDLISVGEFFKVGIIPRLGRKVRNLQLIRETLFISLDIFSLGS